MSEEEFSKLKEGDKVVNLGSGNSYIITLIIDGHILGVRYTEITNPSEWQKILC